MFFISIKKHNRIVDDLRDSYAKKLRDLEKENESKRWNWLKEKSSYTSNLERENKGLKDNNKYLSEDNTALRLEIGLLKENVGDYKALKDELKLAKNSIGGFKANSIKKTKIICELKILIKEKDTIIKDLKKQLEELKYGKYRVVHCRSTKTPKMETSRIIKGPKNAQVNKMLKELGDHND